MRSKVRSLSLSLLRCKLIGSTVKQSRTTMFGARTWDTSLHDFLRLRVRSSGDGMRYFINIQTDGPGVLHPSPQLYCNCN